MQETTCKTNITEACGAACSVLRQCLSEVRWVVGPAPVGVGPLVRWQVLQGFRVGYSRDGRPRSAALDVSAGATVVILKVCGNN